MGIDMLSMMSVGGYGCGRKEEGLARLGDEEKLLQANCGQSRLLFLGDGF